ncbi:MAG TPA: AMP-binding protein [Chloroflexota bacterium]|nr:AMP-binding protein [Chloroflexota bacterium]
MPLELYNLPPQRIQAPESQAAWPNESLPVLLARQSSRLGSQPAIQDGPRTVSFREFAALVDRVAAGLAARGVRPGDVVAYQLPTSVDGVILHYAIARAGAVASPISLLHRERDLSFMLGLGQPKLVVSRPEYRGVPYGQMLAGVVRSLGLGCETLALEDGALASTLGSASDLPPLPDDPNQPLYIVWTSGTTGEPKGVVHTHNTGLCGLGLKLERLGVGPGDAMFVITPIAHHIGIYAMHMLALAGIRLVLIEAWQPDLACHLVQDCRPTFTSGPPTFLIDLLRCEALASHDLSSLRIFSLGGAPVPPPLIEMAADKLPGCRVLASYGTSEEGYVTSASPDDPPGLSADSDGRPLNHMEVRILGPDQKDLAAGEEGDLVVRTPSVFAAYACRPDLTREAFLPGGWRWTGDRAILRDNGSVRITGRSKDIIIRGGINIPVVEVEGALLKHPSVGAVAIVAMPDERLGEKACAYVVPRGELTLDGMRDFLREQQLAPVYWPERLELLDALPMTASGKVQKFRLREMIAEKLRAGG